MDDATACQLNAINRDFYAVTAAEFHATRGQAWRGWDRIVPYLRAPLSVLDVGCGNGRFGVYLAEQGLTPLTYHGIDNSADLLEYARGALDPLGGVEARFTTRDLVDAPLGLEAADEQYDLVACFGVLHHIPGSERRTALVRTLASFVKPGGILAFACWRFYEYARFRERVVAWGDDLAVERGDYLLDWRRGTRALRYCHYVDDAEHAALVAATGLREIESYRADGESGDVNRYTLLRA